MNLHLEQIRTGLAPFCKLENAHMVVALFQGQKLKQSDYYSDQEDTDALWFTFEKCWEATPSSRPTMSTIQDDIHQFLRLL